MNSCAKQNGPAGLCVESRYIHVKEEEEEKEEQLTTECVSNHSIWVMLESPFMWPSKAVPPSYTHEKFGTLKLNPLSCQGEIMEVLDYQNG